MSSIQKRTHANEAHFSPHIEQQQYIGAHPMLQFQSTAAVVKKMDHLDDYIEVNPFQHSEGLTQAAKSAGSWFSKKAKATGKMVAKTAKATSKMAAKTAKQVNNKLAKRRADKAAKSIVAALRKGNQTVDRELKNAYQVLETQRRNDGKPPSGDSLAKKELLEHIRKEIWAQLELTRRKNGETEAFDNELLGAYKYLKEEN